MRSLVGISRRAIMVIIGAFNQIHQIHGRDLDNILYLSIWQFRIHARARRKQQRRACNRTLQALTTDLPSPSSSSNSSLGGINSISLQNHASNIHSWCRRVKYQNHRLKSQSSTQLTCAATLQVSNRRSQAACAQSRARSFAHATLSCACCCAAALQRRTIQNQPQYQSFVA